MMLKPLLGYVKDLLSGVLQPGDIAVDATVGNGHDTLFLAQCVGESGQVYGFDVQEEAITRATARLQEAGVMERVTLWQAGHEQMGERLAAKRGQIKAVTFNLGYLPGGDKSRVTTEQTTLPALKAALDLLAPSGLLTVMLYTGHPQGKPETEAVLSWAKGLDQKRVHVLLYQFWNQKNDPPLLLAIEKRHSPLT
jgi:predicted methyltransferase